jgi:hypothetical protein
MAAMTFFYLECPVCGRTLRVPVKYFGRQMSCGHCRGQFQAGQDGEQSTSRIDGPQAGGADSGLIAHARFGAPQFGEV